MRNAKRITIQISVNFNETLTYIEKLEKKNKVFQKKRNEARRLIFDFFNELKNFEIDIIKFERERTILKIDLKKLVRRRDAILTKILENSKIDVTIKKTFDEKKKNMKKKSFRRRKRAIEERKHLSFSLIEHVLCKCIQKSDLRFFSKFSRIFRIKTSFHETNLTISKMS